MNSITQSTSIFAQQFRCFSTHRSRFTILSVDGGGIRGIPPGILLDKIEKETRKPLAHQFDLMAGTSTGAIFVAGLSKPSSTHPSSPEYTASEVLAFYLDKTCRETIFSRPQPKAPSYFEAKEDKAVVGVKVSSNEASVTLLGQKVVRVENKEGLYKFGSDIESIRPWLQPKYTDLGIETVLMQKFGNSRFSELIPKEVIVPTFCTTTMTPHVWSKIEAKKTSQLDPLVAVATRTSSAAPTYFPAKVYNDQEFVDGGVCVNNPTQLAVLRALELGVPIEDIFCVSIGTGEYKRPVAPTLHHGPLIWASNIFEVASAGSASLTDEALRVLLKKEQYVRIQFPLTENIELDRIDAVAIKKLQTIGNKAIQEQQNQLDRVVHFLKKSRG